MAVVVRHRMAGRTWQEVFASIPVETGFEAPCEGTLINWSKMIDGVDPVNWAPALAPDWRQDGRPKAPCDPEAWDYFEKAIAASGRNGTGPSLRKAHGKAKAEAARQGWTFPNYRTALRHWERLPAERRRVLQTGADAAAKSLTLFQPRTLDGLAAMEQAEVDFREFPVLCIWEDGKIGCPWVGIATDRASSKIVGRSVARSENEEGVIALTRNMVETHGIPDRMVQDNGSAFNGFRVMGGQVPLVRRKDSGERNPKWAVPGVYEFLGIKVENHGPRMAWAKLPESLNSILRHMDNDPVFHRAQRTGPNDAPNPNPVPVPIALFRAVLDQTIAEINADTESRAKGLRKGECRNAAFQRLSAGRIGRWPTPLQRRWMRLKWDLMTVSTAGQVMSGVQFTVTLKDDAVSRAMDRLAAASEDMTGLMNEVGQALVAGAVQRISITNVAPDGGAWQPSRRAAEHGGKTLLKSGYLRDGINAWAGPDHVLVGTAVPYGAVHQLGAATGSLGFWSGTDKRGREMAVLSPWGDIPARPYLGISDEEEEEILGLVEQFYADLLNSVAAE